MGNVLCPAAWDLPQSTAYQPILHTSSKDSLEFAPHWGTAGPGETLRTCWHDAGNDYLQSVGTRAETRIHCQQPRDRYLDPSSVDLFATWPRHIARTQLDSGRRLAKSDALSRRGRQYLPILRHTGLDTTSHGRNSLLWMCSQKALVSFRLTDGREVLCGKSRVK